MVIKSIQNVIRDIMLAAQLWEHVKTVANGVGRKAHVQVRENMWIFINPQLMILENSKNLLKRCCSITIMPVTSQHWNLFIQYLVKSASVLKLCDTEALHKKQIVIIIMKIQTTNPIIKFNHKSTTRRFKVDTKLEKIKMHTIKLFICLPIYMKITYVWLQSPYPSYISKSNFTF